MSLALPRDEDVPEQDNPTNRKRRRGHDDSESEGSVGPSTFGAATLNFLTDQYPEYECWFCNARNTVLEMAYVISKSDWNVSISTTDKILS